MNEGSNSGKHAEPLPPEILELAELSLGNAFYRRFSALVASFMASGKGLDEDSLLSRLSTMASVYSAADVEQPDMVPISARSGAGQVVAHASIANALQCPEAVEITVEGKPVFKRLESGWRYVGLYS